jgi:hypothetical protein
VFVGSCLPEADKASLAQLAEAVGEQPVGSCCARCCCRLFHHTHQP